MLSQNDQNLDPPYLLFDFGNPLPSQERSKLYLNPPPVPKEIVNRVILYNFITTCCNQHL